MPQDLANDFLVVSPREEPPAAPEVARAIMAAQLGAADYAPAPEQAGPPPSGPGARKRLGTYTVAIPGTDATARLVIFSYTAPVTAGMGEAAFASLTRSLSPEDVRTAREGTLALDLRVRSSKPQTMAALSWSMRLLRILLDLTHGTAIDPAAQRCHTRADLATFATTEPLAHVAIHREPWDVDSCCLHTHGLQKFGKPELDLVGVPHSLEGEGRAFLQDVAVGLASGSDLVAGGEIDMEDFGRVVAVGVPVDVDHQAQYGRLRLVDVSSHDELRHATPMRLLIRMALAEVAKRAAAGELSNALEDIERVLAADADDVEALAAKARLFMRQGNVMEALDIGEYVELRVPQDFHGPLIIGAALAGLGRLREALNALDRAISRDPEAAEPFSIRAGVYERLGDTRLAAVDRAHAAYLTRV